MQQKGGEHILEKNILLSDASHSLLAVVILSPQATADREHKAYHDRWREYNRSRAGAAIL